MSGSAGATSGLTGGSGKRPRDRRFAADQPLRYKVACEPNGILR